MFKNYRYGGICSILSALIGLPSIVIFAISQFSINQNYALYAQILIIGHTIISAVIFLFLLEFIKEKLEIPYASKYIYSMIVLGIIITIPELYFDFRDGELYVWYFYVSLGLSVIYGVISIMLGQKMMKSPQGGTKYADSVGMWLAISGFLMATIILAAFNVLTYIALDIYLAMMFFSHTKISLENNNESSPETA